MRNPGRRDGDDARPDPTDPSTPQAGSAEGPADDGTAGVPASHGPADASDPHGRRPRRALRRLGGHRRDPADVADLADSADYDDLLFDPLLSDEPIDLAAVRADDALIDALGGGDLGRGRRSRRPRRPPHRHARRVGRQRPTRGGARLTDRGRDRLRRPGADRRSAPAARGRDAGRRDRRHRIRGFPGLAARRGVDGRRCRDHRPEAKRVPATPTPTTPPTSRIWIRPPSGCCLRPGSARAPARAPTPTPATRPVRYASSPAPRPPLLRPLVVPDRGVRGRPAVPHSHGCAGVLGRRGSRSRRGTRCAAPRSPSSSSRWGSAGPPPAGAPRCRAIPPGRSPRCSSRSGRGRSRRHRSCPRGWSGPSSR